MAESACLVDGCDLALSSKSARGMCSRHYQRWLRTGVPDRRCETCAALVSDARRFCSDECKPRCGVADCESPQVKRGWCAAHYAQARRTGADPVPFAYQWAARCACVVCGAPSRWRLRKFCSGACYSLWRHYEGRVPVERTCVGCGCIIDLTQRGRGGQRKKSSVKFCRRCRQDYDKYKMTAAQLAARDGTGCGICGEPVDMGLRRSDLGGIMCPSVDHILPRALGGSDEPGNLQLTHLYCNIVKSDGRGVMA